MSTLETACIVQNRKCSRYQLRLPVLFGWQEKSPNQNGGFTRDISVGGVFVLAQTCPPTGAKVKVELVLPIPDDPGRELRLRCVGKVIRIEWFPHCQGFAIAGDFGHEYLPEMGRA